MLTVCCSICNGQNYETNTFDYVGQLHNTAIKHFIANVEYMVPPQNAKQKILEVIGSEYPEYQIELNKNLYYGSRSDLISYAKDNSPTELSQQLSRLLTSLAKTTSISAADSIIKNEEMHARVSLSEENLNIFLIATAVGRSSLNRKHSTNSRINYLLPFLYKRLE